MNLFNPFTFIQRAKSSSRIDPERDWLLLLIVTTIALAGIIVWNAWVFDTVAGGGVIGTSATTTPPAFNQSSLDVIHTIFENRAAEETKYVSGIYQYLDPSQ